MSNVKVIKVDNVKIGGGSGVIKDISEIVPGYKSIEFREFFSIPT